MFTKQRVAILEKETGKLIGKVEFLMEAIMHLQELQIEKLLDTKGQKKPAKQQKRTHHKQTSYSRISDKVKDDVLKRLAKTNNMALVSRVTGVSDYHIAHIVRDNNKYLDNDTVSVTV